MSEPVKLTIDGQSITVPVGTTILDAAAQLGIEIPVICYHPHLTGNGLCRVCSVDAGGRVQTAACVSACSDGMTVQTQSEDVLRGRRTILEMLASTVNLENAPEIQALLAEYKAEPERFEGGKKRETAVYDDNPFFIRDYNQCINCWRCVQVCGDDAQYAFALSFNGRGFNTTISTFENKALPDTSCVFCGQCVGVCPTGALTPKRESLLEQGLSPDDVFQQTRASSQKVGGMSTTDWEKNRFTRLTQFVPSLICCSHPEILRRYKRAKKGKNDDERKQHPNHNILHRLPTARLRGHDRLLPS